MQPEIIITRPSEKTLLVSLSGCWTAECSWPDFEQTRTRMDSFAGVARVTFDSRAITEWDSGILVFLTDVFRHCRKKNIEIEDQGLPPGVTRMLKLVFSVPEKEGARSSGARMSMLARLGTRTLQRMRASGEAVGFLGEVAVAVGRLFCGKARFRRSDLVLFIQESGAQAVPIVSLISLLVGLILAFTGAVQLMLFGAQIYVASLVGIGMVRVMGAIMVGIIMAGRTGASFAAQLGTMQVNEEIDAFKTLGVSPVEFLVLPRMVALTLMMPLLCVYADLMGILGGLVVGVTMLDLNVWEYVDMTRQSVELKQFWIGIAHSTVFGVLISLAGCMRGMQCGRNSQAVGVATTSAVVTGIVSIIIATAIITVICNVLGI
ncbi:MAG: ABC transporter permease [Desulfobacteraceae bacterium]|nr:ABC transporter permease [Desulfobacteraceae bacterium]